MINIMGPRFNGIVHDHIRIIFQQGVHSRVLYCQLCVFSIHLEYPNQIVHNISLKPCNYFI